MEEYADGVIAQQMRTAPETWAAEWWEENMDDDARELIEILARSMRVASIISPAGFAWVFFSWGYDLGKIIANIEQIHS